MLCAITSSKEYSFRSAMTKRFGLCVSGAKPLCPKEYSFRSTMTKRFGLCVSGAEPLCPQAHSVKSKKNRTSLLKKRISPPPVSRSAVKRKRSAEPTEHRHPVAGVQGNRTRSLIAQFFHVFQGFRRVFGLFPAQVAAVHIAPGAIAPNG